MRLLALLAAALTIPAWADLTPLQEPVTDAQPAQVMETPAAVVQEAVAGSRYQAVLMLHTEQELRDFLSRADALAGQSNYQRGEPVAVVLYGDEIGLFARTHYRENKALVDLAARLDAFNVVDLKVCQQWLGKSGLQAADLPSFLQPVDDGAAEIQRLQQAGYASF
ncbi:DsrE family protein [Thalassolituus sp. LLYu03]|uniref:DsrE family protein n=1 Tax=Thalassolituus sp. LLYu03 TaxID=3421656 RepID=UPI003D29F480